jgi:hypothetical protein
MDNPEEELRKKAERDRKMEAHGYDPGDPVSVALFEDLEAQRADGKIRQQDVFRRMENPTWKDVQRHPELARRRQEERDKQNALKHEHDGLQPDQTGGRKPPY